VWSEQPSSSIPSFSPTIFIMSDAVVPDATKTKLEAIMQNMIALQKGM